MAAKGRGLGKGLDSLIPVSIGEDKIIKEDDSTSTEENVKLAMDKMRDNFGSDGYKAAFATTNYHVFRTGMLCLNDMQEILDRAERQGLDFMHSKNAYSFSDRKFPLSAEESFKVLDTSLGLWEEELHLNREKVMGGSTEDESLFKQAIKNLFISVPTGTP